MEKDRDRNEKRPKTDAIPEKDEDRGQKTKEKVLIHEKEKKEWIKPYIVEEEPIIRGVIK